MRRSFYVVVLAALFVLSCQGAMESQIGTQRLTLAIEDGTIELVRSHEVDEAPAERIHGDTVLYRFHPLDGSPTIEGEVEDTRVLRSEFDEHGAPDPQWVLTGTGLLEVHVPAIAGQLELWGATGELLGQVVVDPDAPAVIRSELLGQADILSRPTSVVNHGPSASKVDILFLPEGYRESELSQFHEHVRSITSRVSRHSGYKPYWNRFNVWRQDVRSRSSGTGSSGRPADTAFETAAGISGVDRCVFFSNSRGLEAAKNLGDGVDADVVIVLVNRTRTGACARSGVIVTSRPAHVSETVAHEIGHALFGLADEYDTPRPGGYCATGPNVSASYTNLPWASMLTTNRLPTPSNARSGTIGAFKGGGYCSEGRYRPAHDCLMRNLGVDLCPVCRAEIARKMSDYPAGSGSPSSSSGTPSSGGAQISAPTSLSPNGVRVPNTDVQLEWSRSTGASDYKVQIQREVSGRWQTFGSTETTGTAARVTIRETGGQYRWRVDACDDAGCAASPYATFDYGPSASSGTSTSSSSGSSTTSAALAAPDDLRPTSGTQTSDTTPSMQWDAVSGATHYQFKMVWQDANDTWKQYVSAQAVDSTRVSTTLRTPGHWYAFAVQACNSSGCSDWSDYSTIYLRP